MRVTVEGGADMGALIQLIVEPAAELDAALGVAADLARRCGGQLHVLDVLPRPPRRRRGALEAEMIDMVIEHARHRAQRLAARAREIVGQPGRVLVKTVEGSTRWYALALETAREEASLVVVPAGAAAGGSPFGSVSHHLFRKCPRPVVSVKAPLEAAPRKILVALDPGFPGTDERALADAVLREASALSSIAGAELHVASAWRLWGEAAITAHYGERRARPYVQRAEEDARSLLSEALEEIEASRTVQMVHMRNGDPEDVVPGLARELGVDLVVLGTAARTGLQGFLIGSKAESILGRLHCSAMTVKPPGFVSPLTS
jgi:universal stress protein E